MAERRPRVTLTGLSHEFSLEGAYARVRIEVEGYGPFDELRDLSPFQLVGHLVEQSPARLLQLAGEDLAQHGWSTPERTRQLEQAVAELHAIVKEHGLG